MTMVATTLARKSKKQEEAAASEVAHEVSDAAWRERERTRLANGTYKRIPWELDPHALPAIQDHYAHISVNNPDLIAYTVDERKGRRDIQTPLKPGKYLAQYYKHLGEAKIRELSALVVASNLELYWAKTPEEITRVYRDGPSSCYSGHDHNYIKRAYAGYGNFEVAYLQDKKGKITARGVVAIDGNYKGKFFSLYGDLEKLKNKLNAAGYKALGS